MQLLPSRRQFSMPRRGFLQQAAQVMPGNPDGPVERHLPVWPQDDLCLPTLTDQMNVRRRMIVRIDHEPEPERTVECHQDNNPSKLGYQP